ncbi:MFS transporter [Streptomyces sp. NPDC050095]|uniref:MFS transporter n=1 Tax=unclassified Streptomyces TaxID=2593676 RepID=UPI00342C5F3F
MSTQTEPRRASVAPARTDKPSRTLLIGLSLGYFMVLLDTTIVSVALPAISSDLHIGLSGLQWVTNGYTITFAALLLTAGWLSDRFGGRKVFLWGLALFGILSGITAASNTLGMLVALRLALGVAGALLLPASLAVITNAYTVPAERARAVGNWAAITGAALAAGPLIGGALTDSVGWRAIFLVNVPLALVSFIITAKLAPETARKQRSSLDVPGQISSVVAIASLSYALIEGPDKGWGTPAVLIGFGLTLIGAIVFLAAEKRAGDAAMLPLRMFRSRGFSTSLTVGLFANFGLSGLLFVLALYFQESRGYSSFTSGLAFLPLTLPTAFNPMFTGRLVGRIGPRRPATIGFVLMGIGALLQAPFTGDSALALTATIVGLFAFGCGVSFALPALVAGMASSVPPEFAGIGAGALNSARQVGASLGVAALGVILGLASTNADGTRWTLIVSGTVLLIGGLIAFTGLRPRNSAS